MSPDIPDFISTRGMLWRYPRRHISYSKWNKSNLELDLGHALNKSKMVVTQTGTSFTISATSPTKPQHHHGGSTTSLHSHHN